MVRAQLEALCHDEGFRSSKRSVAFLRYVVEQTLQGEGERIKERTIGVEVFGRDPDYDTNLDHVVRTAASDLRKRLVIYYGDAAHWSELRIELIPGSYMPQFGWAADSAVELQSDAPPEPLPPELLPGAELSDSVELSEHSAVHPSSSGLHQRMRLALWLLPALLLLMLGGGLGIHTWLLHRDPAWQFWHPLLEDESSVLLAVGTARNGVPVEGVADDGSSLVIPSPADRRYVPFADALTMSLLSRQLDALHKPVEIRRSVDLNFSDLREHPVVLVGAFNNPWSLRLVHGLRFSQRVDDKDRQIYIHDARNPGARTWVWKFTPIVGQAGAYGSSIVHDYALISRFRDPQTGRIVVMVGGLESYATQVAGEFLTDSEQLRKLSQRVNFSSPRPFQIVLETTVTDGTPGTPQVLAVWQE